MSTIKYRWWLGCGVALLSFQARAGFVAEEFSAITRKNMFRLAMPTPEQIVEVKPELPVVTLQGLSALLDRRQALLKIQAGAKPNPTETCCILGEGQERNGVKVLRIEMESGVVWLTNQGSEQILTIKR